jgi:hypothetical protein
MADVPVTVEIGIRVDDSNVQDAAETAARAIERLLMGSTLIDEMHIDSLLVRRGSPGVQPE